MKRNNTKTPRCPGFCGDRAVAARAKAALPRTAETVSLAAFLGAFADNTRARLLLALRSSELCVCDLSRVLGMSLSAVSHQLRLLRGLNLVKHRRKGRLAFYSLSDAHVAKILDMGLAHIRE